MTEAIKNVINSHNGSGVLPLKPHLVSGALRICGVWMSCHRIVICDAADHYKTKYVDEIREDKQRAEVERLLFNRLQTLNA